MAVLSFSIYTIVKGAIALSKSAAVKTFLAKNGAAIVGKLGVDGAVTAGVTTAGIAGVAITAINLPKDSIGAFSSIIKGIKTNDKVELFHGIQRAIQVYQTSGGFYDDFNAYINTLDLSPELRATVNVTVKETVQVLIDKIEGTAYDHLRKTERTLEDKNVSDDSYQLEVNKIYARHTQNMFDDYSIVLGRAGLIYADMCELNRKLHLLADNTFDHYFVFCMAGWFLREKKNLMCLSNVSQDRLAHDITENIFSYLRYIGK